MGVPRVIHCCLFKHSKKQCGAMVMSATRAELSQKLANLGFITGTRVQGLCLSWCLRPQPPKDLSEKVPQQHPQIPENKAQLTAKALGSPSKEGTAKCWGARNSP